MSTYKNQTFSHIRDEPTAPVKHYALLDDPARQPRRRSRATMTVALVVIGLLAGWIGGISLSGAFQHTKPTNVPPNGQQMEEPPAQPSQQQQDSRPPANVVAPSAKSTGSRDAQTEPQSGVELQPPRATPIDEDKSQEDRKVEVPTGEQSTKEIGQNAIEKILKENEKIKRGKHLKANKNEE